MDAQFSAWSKLKKNVFFWKTARDICEKVEKKWYCAKKVFTNFIRKLAFTNELQQMAHTVNGVKSQKRMLLNLSRKNKVIFLSSSYAFFHYFELSMCSLLFVPLIQNLSSPLISNPISARYFNDLLACLSDLLIRTMSSANRRLLNCSTSILALWLMSLIACCITFFNT